MNQMHKVFLHPICGWDIAEWWMIHSCVVRASDCQCPSLSTSSLGFDPSILRRKRIWGAAGMKECWTKVDNENPKIPLLRFSFSTGGRPSQILRKVNQKQPIVRVQMFFNVMINVGDPWHYGANPDPRICTSWLMDPDPTPDPTPFFSDFKDAKKKFPTVFWLFSFINFIKIFC